MNTFLKYTTRLFILLSGSLLIACQPDSNTTNRGQTCMQLTAQQAGTQIVDIYKESIIETAKLVKDQPDANTITAQFDDLLNSWQKKLLTIGQHILNMSEAEKKQVEAEIRKAQAGMQYNEQDKQQFTAYSQGVFPYHKTSPDLYQKLKSINIITQFAFFDLLKKQNKDAIEKWGHLMVPFKCPE